MYRDVVVHDWISNYFFCCLSMILIIIVSHVASAVLSISIVSDPPGPVYQTASLINFTCVVDEQTPEDSLTYQWLAVEYD